MNRLKHFWGLEIGGRLLCTLCYYVFSSLLSEYEQVYIHFYVLVTDPNNIVS